MNSGRKYALITDKNIIQIAKLSNLKIGPHYADQKVNNAEVVELVDTTDLKSVGH